MGNHPDTLTPDEVNMLMMGNTIKCIQSVRNRLLLGLLDAKNFVYRYAREHGVKMRWMTGQRTN